MILFAVSLGLSAVFWFAQGWAVVAVYAGLTFCYSALAAVLPALSTDLFGFPHAGVNYGFLALGQSVGEPGVSVYGQSLGAGAGAAHPCHCGSGGRICRHLGPETRPAAPRAPSQLN